MIPSKLVKKSANNQEQITIQLELIVLETVHQDPTKIQEFLVSTEEQTNQHLWSSAKACTKPSVIEIPTSSHSKLPKTRPPTMWKIDWKVLMWLILRELCEVQRVLSCLLCLFPPSSTFGCGQGDGQQSLWMAAREKNCSRLLFVQ